MISLSTGATFTYDENGNLTHGDGRDVTFDSLDRPITVTMGSVTTQFRYAPDGSRYLQRTTGLPAAPYPTKTVYYVAKDYERIDWSSTTYEEKTYIGPSVAIYNRNRSSREIRYLHVDRLGSTDSITNAGAFEVGTDGHGFDAFGKPRGRDWSFSSDKLHPSGDYGATTEHGFTGHEHLDDTYLIHMNGRVYDYRLGRFLSVDPIISNPANSQSINPYSYIGNNPLSGVDPTGYQAECPSSQQGTCGGAAQQWAKSTARVETLGSHIVSAPGKLVAPISNVMSGGTPLTPGLIAAANNAWNALSGAQPQTAQPAGSNATTQGSPGQTAQTSQSDAGQNSSPARTPDSSLQDAGHQGYKIFGTPKFIEAVEAQMDTLRTTAAGAELLKQLEVSQFLLRIKEGAESYIRADDDRAASDGRGSGSVIRHNPTATPLAPTASGPMPTAPAVVLGHELVHAVDISKGELNTRLNVHTGVPRFEEKAVKIENLIRRELGGARVGLPDRTGYRLEP